VVDGREEGSARLAVRGSVGVAREGGAVPLMGMVVLAMSSGRSQDVYF
jgi:L-aminopeptidase/D-esterase-like protein